MFATEPFIKTTLPGIMSLHRTVQIKPCVWCSLFLLLSPFTATHAQHLNNAEAASLAADSQFIRHGHFYTFFWGNNYRDVWATPVQVPLFYLSNHKGHQFTPIKTGGGLQTRSLLVQDETGNEWALRSVQKNPANWVNPFWRKTFVRKIVQDQVSGSFPYGALVVPDIAAALQIDHNNPQLVVIQPDSSLGKYREEFAGRLCFLEERNPAGKTISTEKLLRLKDSLPGIKTDSIAFLKCRFMDIVIGDWDRHAGQYRWYGVTKNGQQVYKPVPNDRDQVFFAIQGVLPGLILKLGFMKYMEGFSPEIKNINGFMKRGRSLDRKVLANTSYEQWVQTAATVKAALTDDVLRNALSKLPAGISCSNAYLLECMTARRDRLLQITKPYYKKITGHK